MVKAKKGEGGTNRRKSPATREDVINAAKTLERRNKRPASEAEVRRWLGGGSPNFVSRELKKWRASEKRDGIRKQQSSEAPAGTSKRNVHVAPDATSPDGEDEPISERDDAGSRGVPRAAGRMAGDENDAPTPGLDRLQAVVLRLVTDVRLLSSDVQALKRQVDTLSNAALTEPRRRDPADADTARTEPSRQHAGEAVDTTTDPQRGSTAPEPPERIVSPSPSMASDDATIRERVKVAIFYCVAKLVEVGLPMSIKQLHNSIPEVARVGTSEDFYQYVKIRARAGKLIKYSVGNRGMFEAGPGAAAYLAEHSRQPVVHLTKLQTARIEGERWFLAALDLLEKAGGGPLAVEDFVKAFSDGSVEGARKVKSDLKNSLYKSRRDEGRSIGKLNGQYVLKREPNVRSEKTTSRLG